MNLFRATTLLCCLALFAAAFAGPAKIKPLKPGATAPAFTLEGHDGTKHSLTEALESSRFVIVDFWSTKCPVSRRYEDKLTAIANDYAERGVKVVAVMSNQTESPADVKAYTEERPVPYTVVIDPGSKIADLFGAETTPHIFVLDSSGAVRYTGSIDNGSRSTEDLRPHLRDALDALLDGNDPPQKKTKHFGCSIKRKAS